MKNYDNFFLPVNDLNAAKRFYSNVLGLQTKFDFSEKGMIAFKVGNQEPSIILRDTGKFKEAKSAIWFVVDNVEREYRALEERGIAFVSEPFCIQTGMVVEFEDPSGNRFGITDYTR